MLHLKLGSLRGTLLNPGSQRGGSSEYFCYHQGASYEPICDKAPNHEGQKNLWVGVSVAIARH